jgi:hypothetical protein
MRLKQGLIAIPAGCDVVEFFRHDGDPPAAMTNPPVLHAGLTLADLRDRYLDTHANGTLEVHTLRGLRRHFKQLGHDRRFPLDDQHRV